jgi:Bacterial TSP3 repeat
VMFFGAVAHAYPPAPTHTIYGTVRSEYGEPLTASGVVIIFESTNGVQVFGEVVPGLAPGVNYQMGISMDSGVAPDTYKPTAFKPTLPFIIKVKIGTTTYLPIEMTGSYASLGKPAASTRIDLTLGVDSDNDGLPDAWEQLLITILGSGTLGSILPGADSDGDGICNLDEYYAGTYAFDPEDGFVLDLVKQTGNKPLLKFTVLNARTYTLSYSSDLKNWTPVDFNIPAEGLGSPVRPYYQSGDIRSLEVSPQLPVGATNSFYHYKVTVQ